MGRIFGTDGVRGLANRDLTAELAVDLSVAAAHVLGEAGAFADQRPTAVVARDTRASGEFLEAAVVAGLASAGVDVHRLGVVPTPGAAYLTALLEADMGVMISASHNPMPDNGIKFLARGGVKLDDAIEAAIEQRLHEAWDRPTGADVGRVGDSHAGLGAYVRHLLDTLPIRLDGLRVVLDCANGATYEAAPDAFERAGAEVIAIHAAPDGLNINEACGSTHLDDVRRVVVERGADVGFAFDGDADRCLAVDQNGEVVDGDQILAILALRAKREGRLVDDTVVATVMSNLGFTQAMEAAGITVRRTAVGDRYVLEAMREGGYSLGGEQSGHVIMSRYATTGDGTLTALQLAAEMASTGRTMSELAAVMERLPQVLLNVGGVDREGAKHHEVVLAEVAAAEAKLGDNGRVLLRPSGTEQLVRVMVEAPTAAQAHEIAEHLAGVVRTTLAL
ncbi:phosphoglucosamine mutase [Aeromicrobium sp. 636]|uniref:Phosphoglucosamine mutase n=1 Tax=Aeromicrobium senzhongii TaxID=2663859 RepID=A0A8I0K1G7_9ACTN|nr:MULTISPECIES: phosphoglucosamine mutase [Aeromicrobium]MBC9227511.1 phosphoglucosamine mutase [Aeromicrobium senzhongii]MCQ3999608.1 phosphoglucosamine mutase [Aeromicrobium sp. 636]MTB88073.1 phosphoglucosamine mutase [Aeromicrobium senzhongii]QNL94929.1 phosphoglucosamine mutase [Aeromicrobium senzhongii]